MIKSLRLDVFTAAMDEFKQSVLDTQTFSNPLKTLSLADFRKKLDAVVTEQSVKEYQPVVASQLKLNIQRIMSKDLRLDHFMAELNVAKYWLAENTFATAYNEPFRTFEYVEEKSSLWLPEITPQNIEWVYEWAHHARQATEGYDAQTPSWIYGDPDFAIGEAEFDWEQTTHDRFNGSTTYQSWMDKRQNNTDIPDELHSFDQGLSQRRNDHLDHQHLNDRDFRQRCVVIENNLHVVFEKRLVDFKLPPHHDPEYVMDVMGCEIDTAIQIIEGFKALDLKKNDALAILHQEEYFFTQFSPNELAEYLEDLTFDIEEPEWDMMVPEVDDPDEDPMEGEIYLVDEVLENIKHPDLIDDTPEGEEPVPNIGTLPLDEIKVDENAEVFGTFRLYHENEALSHEFLQIIRTASSKRIADIQRGFFETTDEETGRTYPPKYDYLTRSQKAQAWVYIKERKQQLLQYHRANLSPTARLALDWLKKIKSQQIGAKIIFCCKSGSSFNYSGASLQIEAPIDAGEIKVLWEEFNKLYPKD